MFANVYYYVYIGPVMYFRFETLKQRFSQIYNIYNVLNTRAGYVMHTCIRFDYAQCSRVSL